MSSSQPFNTSNPLAQPVPVGPTDEELDKVLFQAVSEYMERESPFGGPTDQRRLDRAKARAVLQRWGGASFTPIPSGETTPMRTVEHEGRSYLVQVETVYGTPPADPEDEIAIRNVSMGYWTAGLGEPWPDDSEPTDLPKPEPEPVGPTDEELDSMFHEHCWTEDDLMDHDDFAKAARAVLQRWGRPAITPIPLSERLPGAEDCAPEGSDAVGCCWLWEPDINGHDPLGAWKLEHRDWASDGDYTYWLPFHALPLPPAT